MTTGELCYRLKSTGARIFCMTVYYDYWGALLQVKENQRKDICMTVYYDYWGALLQIEENQHNDILYDRIL